MMERIQEVIADALPGIEFEPMINIAHNYAAWEHHYGKNVIVHIKVYEDRTFDWVCLGQPVDDLIREAIKIEKGSGKPNVDKVGKITRAQLEEIANKKMDQLNANDIEGAIKIVAGTARSMGVEVVD